jgi:two-component system response regulator YesN
MPPLTVVVVDDTLDYRQLVWWLLAELSDAVTVVGEGEDGEEGLMLVRRERHDVVITDLMMPRLNGLELTKCIKKERPETKVVLMTSYTDEAYQVAAFASGADAFVNKQVITTSLRPVISDLIARRLFGGSGPLPPSAGGASASAAAPK